MQLNDRIMQNVHFRALFELRFLCRQCLDVFPRGRIIILNLVRNDFVVSLGKARKSIGET